MNKRALVIGSGAGGIQAALDLAEAGIEVHLVELAPFLGPQTAGVPDHVCNSSLLEIQKPANTQTWNNTTLE